MKDPKAFQPMLASADANIKGKAVDILTRNIAVDLMVFSQI